MPARLALRPRAPHHTSIARLLLIAAAACGALAAPAAATPYTVHPCTPGVTAFPGAEMLSGYSPPGYAASIANATNACASGGGFQVNYGPPADTLVAGLRGGYAVTIPAAFPNARLMKITTNTRVGSRTGEDFYIYYYDITNNQYNEGGGVPVGTGVLAAYALTNDVMFDDPTLSYRSRAYAWLGMPSGNHPSQNVQFKEQPNLKAYDLTVVIDDPAAPTWSAASTGLLDGTDQYGKRVLSVAAVDVDSGVKSVSVKTAGGEVLGTISGTCTYQSVEACQRQVDGDFAVDTSKLTPGRRTLTVTVTDGAGNVKTSETPSFNVVTPPVSAQPNGGGQTPGGGTGGGSTTTGDGSTTGGSTGTTTTAGGAGGALGTGPAALLLNGNPKGTPLVVAGSTATAPSKKPESLTSTYGRTFTIKGRLLAADRSPMTGATLDVLQTSSLPGAQTGKVASITTDAKGRYTFAATAGASGTYRIAHPAHVGGADYTAGRLVKLAVRARATLVKKPAGNPSRGTPVTFSGQIGAALIPSGGARIAIQYHAASGAWLNADVITTDDAGTYTWKHTFKTATRYRLRTRVLSDRRLPNTPGVSAEVRFRVR